MTTITNALRPAFHGHCLPRVKAPRRADSAALESQIVLGFAATFLVGAAAVVFHGLSLVTAFQ
jgi:hypothetical protein